MQPTSVREHRSHSVGPVGADGDPFAHIAGTSTPIRAAIALARQVAASPLTTVLLEGETGTGKELFARGIHNASTCGQPFVAINCAAIPGELLESELFGHERGAFTSATSARIGLLEHAGSGTVFLDEVNELPLDLQSKLLRVLEDRAFRRVGDSAERALSCRVIAGTNCSLHAATASGRFRADLYFRLDVFRIELPPLRARPADIAPIAERLLGELAARRGGAARTISAPSRALLEEHDWPGNVRELRNVLERATIVCAGAVIQPEHLTLRKRQLQRFGDDDKVAGMIAIPRCGRRLDEVEHEAIRVTMQITHGNLSEAARILCISRPTLMRKLQDAGLTRRTLLASS